MPRRAADCCPARCAFCNFSPGGKMVSCPECLGVNYCCERHLEAHARKHRFACLSLQKKRAQLALSSEPRLAASAPVPSGPGRPPPNPKPALPARLPPLPSNAKVLQGDDGHVIEVGHAAWKLMHEVADRFPDRPSTEEKQGALHFLSGLSVVYPCEKCRLHFQVLLKRFPPDVSTRAAFAAWMSYFHDQVNVALGKAPHRGP
eukprot:GGOE01061152.1.p1 GENE.GGOE01061152.1~~GGOE01061152.1.p1  ORF type:complete len:203 (-),score=44.58 GGOE01061152.1:212-820(-)